jgi:hypothetical protein
MREKYLLRSDIIEDVHSTGIEHGKLRSRCRWFHTGKESYIN